MPNANPGQTKRIADKLKRNLDQILRTQVDGLVTAETTNTNSDRLVSVGPSGAWSSTNTYALIKIQEMPLSSFPVQGFPVHKVMICVEGDNATLASVRGATIDAGYLAEFIARCKDLGCAVELYVTALGTQPADQDTDGGTFNSGTGSALKRHIRASVDTLGMGQ